MDPMNEQKIIEMLLDHEERLVRIEENMVTKAEMRGVYEGLDAILTIVKRTEQELIMIGQRVSRNEKNIEVLQQQC